MPLCFGALLNFPFLYEDVLQNRIISRCLVTYMVTNFSVSTFGGGSLISFQVVLFVCLFFFLMRSTLEIVASTTPVF